MELASCCAWGDETLLLASAAELGPSAITPQAISGLSDDQYAVRNEWNVDYAGLDWRPNACAKDSVIAWMTVSDGYSGEERLAPADAILIGRREPGDAEAVAIADSNGCACGESLDAAKLAALLELIERDALARWWYGRRGRRTVRPPASASGLPSYLEQRPRRSTLFDITTDIGIPVFAAVSWELDGSDVVIASAADVDPMRAAASALTEMLQMEFNLASQAEIWSRWRRDVGMHIEPLSLHQGEGEVLQAWSPNRRPSDILRACLAACRTAGVSLYFIDMTRPAFGLPVIRALSTDLCHFKPRFARRRLLDHDDCDCVRTAEARHRPNPVILLV